MIRNYFKIAWRNLKNRKIFAFINIFGLAIGFGSSIIIYLFLTHHLSFDNFHSNSDRIYRVTTELHRDNIGYTSTVPPAFSNVFQEDYNYAEKVAKIVLREELMLDLTKNGNAIKFKQDIAFVEEDFFQIFNFPLLNGSNIVPLSEPNTAIITENKAQILFGKTDVVGETFVLENNKVIEIRGVLKNIPKASFLEVEIFISYDNLVDIADFFTSESWGGTSDSLQCFALLKPDQNLTNIETALLELPKKYRPGSKNRHVYKLQPLSKMHFNPDYGGLNPTFLIVFGVIGLFLIVIACINFVNISTAQAFYRSKEIGIRKVLGSFKKHLFWQFMIETFLISLFAVTLGVLIAIVFLPSFNNIFELQLSLKSLFSFKFFGFLATLLGLVALLSGSYPGILMSRIVPVLALKGKLSYKDTGGNSTRKLLVVAQFAISIMLIVATLVISKQIDYSINSELGFDKESIVMLNVPQELKDVQFTDLKERLKQIPGVQHVSFCFSSPGAVKNDWGTGVKFNNRPENEDFNIQAKLADVDYLKTFNIPLVAGRNFFKSDSLREVLVNEKFATKLGLTSHEELLGKKLEVNGGRIQATVVGVVKDFHNVSFTSEIDPIFIGSITDWYSEVAVKINYQNAKSTLEQIDKQWSQTFSNYVYEYRFLDERVAEQYEIEQRYLSISKIFSGLAIFIGCLGLYGLILFFIGQRTKEVGIRKVLGSNVISILILFSKDFFKLILIAGVIATPITWYFMKQWLQGYVYRTEIQWIYFAYAIGVIMLITLITIGYQTLKVAVANPIKSLRTE